MIHKDDLITPAYRAEQAVLHADPRGYGGKGKKWADVVETIAREYGASSMLDYGCGQGSLAIVLRDRGWTVREYDPAIPGKDERPSFADLVVCTDVLEHVERERLPAVLGHVRSLCRQVALLVVALDPSNKTLRDGRNAHLILESPDWWAEQVRLAGFTEVPRAYVSTLPLPVAYADPLKRAKRWIAVVTP